MKSKLKQRRCVCVYQKGGPEKREKERELPFTGGRTTCGEYGVCTRVNGCCLLKGERVGACFRGQCHCFTHHQEIKRRGRSVQSLEVGKGGDKRSMFEDNN